MGRKSARGNGEGRWGGHRLPVYTVAAAVLLVAAVTVSARFGVPRGVWEPLDVVAWNTPGMSWAKGLLWRGEAVTVAVAPTAGDPAMSGALYRPVGGGEYPRVLFVNGIVGRGWRNPEVEQVARSLAGLGFVVYVPNLPALRNDELTAASLKALGVDLRQFGASRPADKGRVSLFGVCAGASLAILAAEQPGQSGEVRVVAAVDPYASLRDLLEAATVGRGANARGVVEPFRMSPWAAWVIAHSVAATLAQGAGRRAFLATLGATPALAPGPSPLAAFGRTAPPAGAGQAVDAWWRLLANRRPARFAALYEGLPQGVRGKLRALSPVDGLGGLRAPVLIAAPVTDFAYPAGEAAALAAGDRRGVQLYRSSALDHVRPALGVLRIGGYVELWVYIARMLGAMRGGGGVAGGMGVGCGWGKQGVVPGRVFCPGGGKPQPESWAAVNPRQRKGRHHECLGGSACGRQADLLGYSRRRGEGTHWMRCCRRWPR